MEVGFYLPNKIGDLQIFACTNTNAVGNNVRTWVKPKKAKLVYIVCIGAGGGGASGVGAVATTASRNGGGGGSSGCITGAWFPAMFLPDTLYVYTGVGGAGGASVTSGQSNGTAGTASYVFHNPSFNTSAFYNMISFANGGNGAVANAGGTAGVTHSLDTRRPANYLGGYYARAGVAGTAATAGGGGGADITQASVLSGGTAGGGNTYSSPNYVVNPAGSIITNIYGYDNLVTEYAIGADGINGYTISPNDLNDQNVRSNPLFFTGGTGGCGGTTTIGGRGGDGGIGCGGGGGGSGVNSGAGGRGGDGLVFIVSC